jgi:(S)-citramalyl-CoA lyase
MTECSFVKITAPLFVPGHQPERFTKAETAARQGIIIDLEDAVAAERKDDARAAAALHLAQRGADGVPVLVRLNPLDTPAGISDILAVSSGALRPDGLVMPKVESGREIEILRAHAGEHIPICALIETARGLNRLDEICAVLRPGEALALGGADLVVDLNARFTWDGLFSARAALVQAAARAGLIALDVPYLELRDELGLRAECERLRDIGFSGKLAIHPAQVDAIKQSFLPDDKERKWAERILSALADAKGSAVRVDGKLVDLPIRRMAERVLAKSG